VLEQEVPAQSALARAQERALGRVRVPEQALVPEQEVPARPVLERALVPEREQEQRAPFQELRRASAPRCS
jgi:hypothetical protein